MKQFSEILNKDKTYQQIASSLKRDTSPILLMGLSACHKAHYASSLATQLGKKALIIVPTEQDGAKMRDDINCMLGDDSAVLFPLRELTFYQTESVSLEYEHARLGILSRILNGNADVVIATPKAAGMLTLPMKDLKGNSKALSVGTEHKSAELEAFLVNCGYTREKQVDGVAQFAVRGGIVDIFPVSAKNPYRIEFWGDEIDTIAAFETTTQRRLDSVDSIEITPVREALIGNSKAFIKKLEKLRESQRGKLGKLAKESIDKDIDRLLSGIGLASADRYLPVLYEGETTLFDYCSDYIMFYCEPAGIKHQLETEGKQFQLDIQHYLEEGVLFSGHERFGLDFADFQILAGNRTTVIMDTFTRSIADLPLRASYNIEALQLSPWNGDMEVLLEDVRQLISIDYAVIIMAGTEANCQKLYTDLLAENVPTLLNPTENFPEYGKISILEGSMSAGMSYPSINVNIITHIKAKTKTKKRRSRHKAGKKISAATDLNIGDYVVHSTYGIGVFGGITKRTIQGITKDFIELRYAGTDSLLVPVTQLDFVSKYIGAPEGKAIKLNRLNSADWQKTRSRVKGAVKEMARELIALYAKRQNTKGYSFSKDTDWQAGFEARFPYEETDDQLMSVEEIKRDMEKPMPMDRLLCGDVGFGKTEVALRAVFKCVMESKQCAVLVPTTILAWQHYQTFLARFEGYPIRVELLSRFRTPKQQKQILKDLKAGIIDVVIGTHRVVQKDVEFKDLGLCIIDEEQRFGVAHKEHFKELRTSVDILTLSATPIPRTLNMAMSGIRDMSLIEDPPSNRHPVQTYVMEYNGDIVTAAIEKELSRGGQVFYLHNNTYTINACARRLQEALPDANIVVAHGKMGEDSLSDIWQALVEQEIDVLVCTTIVETGVDVPNANTLIVENADNYGLSQLYQLRGRVGRSSRRAYCYLTFNRGKELTDIAAKRLTAIREFTTFGSGFQIAMRDLEIRGAGNILGANQHGHMELVGYDMYLKLLSQAINEESGENEYMPAETIIDVYMDAFIPEEYIENVNHRIEMYKRIASIDDLDDQLDVTDELIDRFGEPPLVVISLLEVSLIRSQASRLGIEEIKQNGDRVLIYPQEFKLENAGELASRFSGRLLINAGVRPYYSLRIDKKSDMLEEIKSFLDATKEILEREQ